MLKPDHSYTLAFLYRLIFLLRAKVRCGLVPSICLLPLCMLGTPTGRLHITQGISIRAKRERGEKEIRMNLSRVLGYKKKKKLERDFKFHLHVSFVFRFHFLLFWIMYSCWEPSQSLITVTEASITSCLRSPTFSAAKGKGDAYKQVGGPSAWPGPSSRGALGTE